MRGCCVMVINDSSWPTKDKTQECHHRMKSRPFIQVLLNWCISDIVFLCCQGTICQSQHLFKIKMNVILHLPQSVDKIKLIHLRCNFKQLQCFSPKWSNQATICKHLKEGTKSNMQILNIITSSSWSRLARNKHSVICVNFKAKLFVALKTHVSSNFPFRRLWITSILCCNVPRRAQNYKDSC